MVGGGSIGERDFETGLAGNGERGHGHAVGEGRRGAARLERLGTDRRKQDAVEAEGIAGGASDGQVAEMGRVKTAAEESHSAAGGVRQARRWLFGH
jgi:hypothetical protein